MIEPPVIAGIIVSPIVTALAIALAGTVVISSLLIRVGFYRLVWHRPLVEAAIFAMLVGIAGAVPLSGVAR